MKRPELLAPAGSFDSLVAAIEAGCDAIYLSGKLYGARASANNFTDEELIKAINYAHLYGVKVYVTINILIYEAEVENFIKYVRFLHQNNVDAVIIQDIGMFDLIHKKFPNLEIHCSTQMHVHNLDGAKLAEQIGAKRVVLARETPIELIEQIKRETNLEIEIFVHGALCISYSGQCLMSSLIGGRSGNRGTCAQCCRQPYDLYCNDKKISNEKYLLSTKDLNTLDNIGQLIEANIDSLKIEGRMKRSEYVYYVVSLYRKAIDSYLKNKSVNITDKDIYELKKIFNRKFTKGFIFHEKNNNFINSFRPNHLGVEIGKVIKVEKNRVTIKLSDNLNVQDGIRFIGIKECGTVVTSMFKNKSKIESAQKNDIIEIIVDELPKVNSLVLKTTDSKQLKEINNLINSKLRKISIDIKLSAKIGQNLKINIIDDKNNGVDCQSDYIVEKSSNNQTTTENIEKQINRLKDTVYQISSLEINSDDNIFIPVSKINELRRTAIEKINEKRLGKSNFIECEYEITLPDYEVEKKRTLYTNNKKYINPNNYDEIILDENLYFENKNNNYRLYLPNVLEKIKTYDCNKYLISELGSILKYKGNDLTSNFTLNVTNSYSVALLHSLGVNKVTLSIELNDYQIKKLVDSYHEKYKKHPNLELIINHRPIVMTLKYDLFDNKYNKNNNYYLKDKYNNKFKVIRKNNLTLIYNYEEIKKDNIDYYYTIGINSLREDSIVK